MRRRVLLICCLCVLLVGMNSARANTPCWVSVAFSPDGRVLASSQFNRVWGIKLWDVKTGALLQTLITDHGWMGIAFSPDGKVLASQESPGIQLWGLKTGAVLRTLKDFGNANILGFSPDGQMLAAGRSWNSEGQEIAEGQDSVKLWDVKSGVDLGTIYRSHPVSSLAFNPDGKMLAASAYEGDLGVVEFFDVRSRAHIRTLKGPQNAGISPDWKVIVSFSHDDIVLWDLKKGAKLWTKSYSNQDWPTSCAFSPDSKVLTSGHRNGSIKLWDVPSGKELRSLSGPNPESFQNDYTRYVGWLAFSPDGKVLASRDVVRLGEDDDDVIKLWDVNTGVEVRTLAPCSAAKPSSTPAPEVKTEKPAPSQTQPQVTQEAGKLRVTVETAILFDLDRSDLKPEAEAVLAQIKSSVMDQHPHARLLVEGYTDDTGGDAHNQELSTRRAQAVAAWLKGHGVDGSRMAIKGYGKANPKYPNTTEANRARNRRVEIVVVD